jgi:hypothetical protein
LRGAAAFQCSCGPGVFFVDAALDGRHVIGSPL